MTDTAINRMSTAESRHSSIAARSSSFDSTGQIAPSMRSSQRTSSVSTRGDSTVNFFRGFLGQRNQDYHTDTADHQQQNQRLFASVRRFPLSAWSLGAASQHPSTSRINEEVPQRCSNAEYRRAVEQNVLSSHAWKAVLIFFAFVLLFGAQIRALFIPKAGDIAVDVVFLLALVFFATDIGMRIDSEDGYFSWICCKNNKCCSVGSFLFWCDFVSTLTLIYDLSFINSVHYREASIDMQLGPFGIPVRTVLLTLV